MSELSIQSLWMPAVQLGIDNPLPSLSDRKKIQFEHLTGIPDEIKENMAYGHIASIFPYSIQDNYNRQLQPVEFRIAVLENEFLRATFLLEFGGRLWSLYHKPSGRELLDVNPVFQLANLALRNAWFSGGVEFNIATTGHSPFTCSPLFACRLDGPHGTPILRLYEWERIRQIPFQVDAYLPDASPLLFLRVRLINPNKFEVPAYWWSNIAVPHHPETRVIVPASTAFCLGCQKRSFMRTPVPQFQGTDFTYPGNVPVATDFFFDIPAGQRPWIAALDERGIGLVQVSTCRLKGRKLWVWGTGTGGKNWQKFLSPPGEGYIEIQAGLTTTQLEHLRMPAAADWSWLEAYGLLEAPAAIIHGPNWEQAVQCVEKEIEHLIPSADLQREYEQGMDYEQNPPVEMLQLGSGWGALERRRQEAFGETTLADPGLVFPYESVGDEQKPWISLIEEGTFPVPDPQTPPRGFVMGHKWLSLLEKAFRSDQGENWFLLLHLGILQHWAGDLPGARSSWERSLECTPNPWAARNLAVLAREQGRIGDAVGLMTKAFRMQPHLLPLVVECGNCLLEAGRTLEWLEMMKEIPQSLRSNGRIRLLEAQAALAEDRLEIVAGFFEDRVVIDDLREGENSITDLWFAYHARRVSIEDKVPITASLRARIREEYPLPEEFDFSMTL